MRKITTEAIGAGTFGALAMMPVGFIFRALEMRVGHYGPKFASLYLEDPSGAALFIQHLILGWVSALPLCLLPIHRMSRSLALAIGALYGIAYYALIKPSEYFIAAASDAKNVAWFPVDQLPPLAFDHDEILRFAFELGLL